MVSGFGLGFRFNGEGLKGLGFRGLGFKGSGVYGHTQRKGILV